MHESKQEKTLSKHTRFPQQPVEQSAEKLAEQVDPLVQQISRIGKTPSPLLSTALRNQPASSSRSQQIVLQIQRQYGNHYVQRMVSLARQEQRAGEATPEVETAIAGARGGGRSLDASIQRQMESAFHTDFSGVRVHTDSTADTLNHALNARAFTTGQDIFFRQGEYNPNSSIGKELLAHELTHVVQQTGTVQGKLAIGEPDDQYEQEADQVAATVMRMLNSTNDAASSNPSVNQVQTSRLQRLCSNCAEELQRQPVEEDQTIQRKTSSESIFPINLVKQLNTRVQPFRIKSYLPYPKIQRSWSLDSSRSFSGIDAAENRGNGFGGGRFLANGAAVNADTWQSKPRWQWCVDGGTAHSARWKGVQYTFKHDGLDNNFLEFTIAGQLSGNAKAEDLHYAKAGAVVVGLFKVRTPTNPTPPATQLFRITDGGKSSANVSSIGDIEATIPLDGASVRVRIPLTAVSEGHMAAFSESLTPPVSHDVAGATGSETFVDVYLAARTEAQSDVESTCGVFEGEFDDQNRASAAASYTLLSWSDRASPRPISSGATDLGSSGGLGTGASATATSRHQVRLQLQAGRRELVSSEIIARDRPVTVSEGVAGVDTLMSRATRRHRNACTHAADQMKSTIRGFPPNGIDRLGHISDKMCDRDVEEGGYRLRVDLNNDAGRNFQS